MRILADGEQRERGAWAEDLTGNVSCFGAVEIPSNWNAQARGNITLC